MNPEAGGVVEAVHQSAMGISNIEVLCFDDPNSTWLKKSRSYKVHALGTGKTTYSINFRYFSWLKKNAKSYDVVILDGIWQFLVVGGFFLSLLKVPYCVFIHGMLDPYFNKDKLKYIKKLPFWFLVERPVISMAAATIFTCQEEAQLARKSFPLFSANSIVSPLGIERAPNLTSVDVEHFYQRFPRLSNRRMVLFLSRVDEKKGVDLLVNAISQQAEQLENDVVFAFAGPCNKEYKQTLIEAINKAGVGEYVVWLGMLEGISKWIAFKEAEVFILPSHQENFGIVVAESLASKTPVLITDKVNIWPTIVSYSAGIVGDDTNEGVTELLKLWFKAPQSRKEEMAEKAMLCFEEQFTQEHANKILTDLLGKVVVKEGG